MAALELNDVRLRYGTQEVLKGISFRVEPSEFVAILGPSGCGKTSLLRVIAGFSAYEGQLRIGGQDMAQVPTHHRQIGIVFQDYALFPHQSVATNIGYGLRMRRMPKAQVNAKVAALIALLQLDGLADRYPGELSGGQRQRVAIARALAIEPRMLLLDEPLSALDKKLREEMQVELRQLQRRVGITTLFVTHDQEEALALADKVVVMHQGAIHQIGTPTEIYRSPADAFVANFIGRSNLVVTSVERVSEQHMFLRLPWGGTARAVHSGPAQEAKTVTLVLRPERLTISDTPSSEPDLDSVSAQVDHVAFMGAYQHVRVRIGDHRLHVQTNEARWREGDAVTVAWRPEDAIALNTN